MAENLLVTKFSNGESINFTKADQDWVGSGSAYCFYDNNKQNQKIYGNLYNWYAIMDQRGICPFGWHVPSREEFYEMEMTLSKANVLSGALKSTSYWNQPNQEAKGYLSFNVLPGGKRWHKSGSFEFLNTGGYFWTSSSANDNRSYYFAFSYDFPKVRKFNFYWGDGFSCRCLKD